MARVEFSKMSGIARISGKVGNLIFYTRGGKQYVKSAFRYDQNGMRLDNGSRMEGKCIENGPKKPRIHNAKCTMHN